MLSQLLASLVHYKSNAALHTGGVGGDTDGGQQQHLDAHDLARACVSPPLMQRASSSGGRLRSAGQGQQAAGGGGVLRSNSNNTYSRLGSGSFRVQGDGGDGGDF